MKVDRFVCDVCGKQDLEQAQIVKVSYIVGNTEGEADYDHYDCCVTCCEVLLLELARKLTLHKELRVFKTSLTAQRLRARQTGNTARLACQ